MIRAATHADIPRIIELGTILHQTSSYARMPFVPEKAAAFIASLINNDGGVVFVAERDGLVIGGMAGGIVDQWFNDELIAYDFSIFIEEQHRHGITAIKLIRAFEHWARAKGCTQIQMGVGTEINVEGTTRLYEALGMKHYGPLLMKEL